jgi:hypothetical protein
MVRSWSRHVGLPLLQINQPAPSGRMVKVPNRYILRGRDIPANVPPWFIMFAVGICPTSQHLGPASEMLARSLDRHGYHNDAVSVVGIRPARDQG